MLVLEFLVDKENITLHQSCSEPFDYIFIRHRLTTECLTGVRLVGLQTSSFFGFNQHVKAFAWFSTISFPEPSCLLVSTKTRSSGIINNLVPRAHVSFAFGIWYCCSFKAKFSTFLVFPVRIVCLCGTKPHRLYLWRPCKGHILFKRKQRFSYLAAVIEEWVIHILAPK